VTESRNSDARRLLERASKSSDRRTRTRAQKFIALTHRDRPDELLAELEKLEPTADVVARMLDIDLDRALEHVSPEPVAVEDDALGWFLWKAKTAEGLDTAERNAFTSRVGPILAKTTREGLLRLCVLFAQKHRLEDERRTC
jgi:hypothetical protein